MKCLSFALALCAITITSAAELTAIDTFRGKFFQTEEELWRNVTDQKWNEKSELGADVELTKAFKKFDEEISKVPKTRTIEVNNYLWKNAVKKLQLIDGMYTAFLEFSHRQSIPGRVPAPVKEWLDLAEHVLMDPTSSVAQAVRKLHDILHHDLFRAVLKDDHPQLCELQLSPHQLIFDMYNTVALTEIKGYAMMQFSWMLLRIYGKGNFTQEASLTRQRYGERAVKTAYAARSALAMAKRNVYRCDPTHHIEGETFEQVTRLLQGYIENEVDLNPDGTCRENCPYYSYASKYGSFAEFSKQQSPCRGKILNCQYIDSDMMVCPSNDPKRRYDWIEYENGRKLGSVGTCRNLRQVDSWWRWLFWHCSYCMCLCDETSSMSHRYFSLKDAVTDVNSNKVVTGLRLIKANRVFHLQVSDGTLGARGTVTPGSWLPVNTFHTAEAREGVDYHTLSYEKRAIDLDELDSPSGSVLTGVRFRMIGAHLHFEIQSTPFNYTTGKLYSERSQWISNDNTDGTDKPRSALELVYPDIPTRSKIALTLDSRHDQYLEFVNTDFEADAAQSTVPFIDIQEVRPLNGASLNTGAGIIHRGARGSGGFIGVTVFSYDYSRHVHADPPSLDFDEDAPDSTEFIPIVN